MRRRMIVAALAIAASSAMAHAEPHGVVIDRVVLVVNDMPVFESEIARRAARIELRAATGDAAERAWVRANSRAHAEAELIEDALMLAAGRDLKVTVTAEEVEVAIVQIKAQNGIDDAALATALVDAGYTLEEYREELERELIKLRTQSWLVPPVGESREAFLARWRVEQRKHAFIERPEAP